jgi:AcrR family transcriptional regulator
MAIVYGAMKTAESGAAPELGPDSSLRTAQKVLTRSRIRDAARALFYSSGYAATTVEQIAAASGASRATFYLHFKDKEEVLQDIVREYTPRALAVMRRLPGPRPTLKQIRAWVGELSAMVAEERVSLTIFRQVGQVGSGPPPYVQNILTELVAALGERAPAFRIALDPGPLQLEARVHADLLINESALVCTIAARHGGGYGAMAQDVLAAHFKAFISDRRFAAAR